VLSLSCRSVSWPVRSDPTGNANSAVLGAGSPAADADCLSGEECDDSVCKIHIEDASDDDGAGGDDTGVDDHGIGGDDGVGGADDNGGAGGDDAVPSGTVCASDADCAAGEECNDGVCRLHGGA
jgi:Cys-rich repeat protein